MRVFLAFLFTMKKSFPSVVSRAFARLTLVASLALSAQLPARAQAPLQAQLAPVLVTATRFDEPAAALPFGVSVLTRSELERSGVVSVNEAIMKLLGVAGRADYYGGGDYGLDLRGFGTTAASNQVVIVDGIKLDEADLGGTRLAGIAIDSVERIEIIRGNGSVLYGGGASGGVILISTRSGIDRARQNAARTYVAAGSYGLREARAGASLAAGDVTLEVSGNQRQSDNYRDNFKSTSDGGRLQAQWQTDSMRVGASHAVDSLETGLPGALSAMQYQSNPALASTPAASATINNQRNSVFAMAKLGVWQLGIDAGWRSKNLDSLSAGVSTYQYAIDASTLGVRGKNQSLLGQAHNALTLGYDQADWKRTVPGTWGSQSQQKSHASYLQDDLTFVSGTRLTGGYRSENISQDDSASALHDANHQSMWELGLTQPLSDSVAVFAQLGNSYRLANVDELGFTAPGALLQPQTSRDAQIGGRWHAAATSAELRYYRNALHNELGYDPTLANANSWSGLGANTNFDPTLRQGVELEARQAVGKTLALRLNLARREARFTQGVHDGMDVPLVARSTLAVRADWRPLPAHSLNAGVVWVGEQFVDYSNLCRVPAYASADLRYAYQLRQLELSFGVSNLLDAKYYTQAFECAAGVSNGIYPEAGRAFTAALRLSF